MKTYQKRCRRLFYCLVEKREKAKAERWVCAVNKSISVLARINKKIQSDVGMIRGTVYLHWIMSRINDGEKRIEQNLKENILWDTLVELQNSLERKEDFFYYQIKDITTLEASVLMACILSVKINWLEHEKENTQIWVLARHTLCKNFELNMPAKWVREENTCTI